MPGKAFPLTGFVMAGLVYKRWVVPTIVGRGGVSKSEKSVGGAQNEREVQKGVSFLLRPSHISNVGCVALKDVCWGWLG